MSEPSYTVLITGATDGLGYAMARHYRDRNANVLMVGRRPLDELTSQFFTADNYCQADLSRSTRGSLVLDWLEKKRIGVLHLVVHNAGLGYVGSLSSQPAQNILDIVAVNFTAPAHLTQKLYPLVERGLGKFVFVSSIVAAFPAPDYAVYAATKAALEGFVRSLRIELAARGSMVAVQLIRPGATRTGIHAKSGATLEQMNWVGFPPADEVAAGIIHSIENGSSTTTIGQKNRLLFAMGKFSPRAVEKILERGKRNSERILTTAEQPNGVALRENGGHCVITGAADGIGRALALRFAAAGYTVTGIDIDSHRAMYTQAEVANAGRKARFIIADLGQHADLVRIRALMAERSPVDVLIHNAGVNEVDYFMESNWNRQEVVIAVNLVAPLTLTAGLLNDGRLARPSSVVLISSLSTYVSYPGAAVYAGTKDGIRSFAQSLSVALSNEGIHVLTVYPGPTLTAHARRYSPDNRNENRRMDPDHLADRILHSVQRNKRQLVPGISNQIIASVGRLLPTLVERTMKKTIFDKLP